ncbi:RNA polymerase sigma factor [Pseudarthrobacter scleromae]|jgi:RNA polymerase sigma factor (sigma-70 family)|uniref:RNA polymerase sigma factor n=1 Tax=Pseudarthrobacter scleromae TaxID=158897 RepID=UPI003CFE0969
MGTVNSADEELWARSLAGDGAAFSVLFRRHRDRVFRHAYRITVGHHNAEDITATAFLELWRLRDKVRLVDGSILPWLLVTTVNVARNNSRALRRHQKLVESLPRSENAPDVLDEFFAGSPQDALDKELSEALRSLNLTDRQLVSLVVFEGYTLASAAKLLAITPSAAKTRMHRARQRMKLSVEHSYVPAMEGNQS